MDIDRIIVDKNFPNITYFVPSQNTLRDSAIAQAQKIANDLAKEKEIELKTLLDRSALDILNAMIDGDKELENSLREQRRILKDRI